MEAQPPAAYDLSGPGELHGGLQVDHPIDARPLLTYLWAETDRAASEVTDPSKETGKSLGQLDALRAVTRQVTKMALGME